jgi:hypothetical protein
MKMLNKSGVKKLNDYINITYGKVFEAHDDVLVGPKSDEVFEDLKKHGIIIEEVVKSESNSGLYRVMVEDMPTPTVPEPVVAKASQVDAVDATGDKEDVEKVKNLAKQLMPYFAPHFATKSEINDALNVLRTQLIDPEELTKLFKDISVKVKQTQGKMAK